MFVNKLINKGYLKPFQRQAKAYCDEFEDEKIPRALSQGRLGYPRSVKTPAVCLQNEPFQKALTLAGKHE
jgi:hypothetical protein